MRKFLNLVSTEKHNVKKKEMINIKVRRGDIYYIRDTDSACGSEQRAGRPGIVVSNDKCNEHSPVIEVVYTTTKVKRHLPTHVGVKTRQPSTALCEQVHSIAKERLGNYMGHITGWEEEQINAALRISLMLNNEGENMDELKLTSNQTANQTPIEIALGIDSEGRTTARKLYEFLDLARGQFSRWAKANIMENTFAEVNIDYWGFDIDVEGNKTVDYIITSRFAKKLSMACGSKKGEVARDYFIAAEGALKESAARHQAPAIEPPISIADRFRAMEIISGCPEHALCYVAEIAKPFMTAVKEEAGPQKGQPEVIPVKSTSGYAVPFNRARLTRYLCKIGWSNEMLGAECGLGTRQITRYVAGQNRPSQMSRNRICNALGKPADWLNMGK